MFSTDKTAQEQSQRDLERKQNKEDAGKILETFSGTSMMASLAQEGGPIGKRIARELRRYESTGRISNWLVGEATKAELQREIPSRQVDESSTRGRSTIALPPTRPLVSQPFNGQVKYAPTIPLAPTLAIAHPWEITLETVKDSRKYKIEESSRLFDGFGGNAVTVGGADGVLRNLEEGFYFIEVDFSQDGAITEAQIQIANDIGPLVVSSGGRQTKLRQQIGEVYIDNNDNRRIRQTAWHNFSLFDICRNGVPVKITIAT